MLAHGDPALILGLHIALSAWANVPKEDTVFAKMGHSVRLLPEKPAGMPIKLLGSLTLSLGR